MFPVTVKLTIVSSPGRLVGLARLFLSLLLTNPGQMSTSLITRAAGTQPGRPSALSRLQIPGATG